MTLSVIIVNYNVRAFLENALVSVQKALAGIEGEIIVVDNASDDGSVEMLRQKFPAVRLIANERNLGFGAANNLALKQARGRYLLLLNPDTVVQEDTFQVMIRYMEGHAEAGAAGCKLLNSDGSFQLPCRRGFPTPWVAFTKISGLSALFPHSKLFGRYNLTYLDPDGTYPVDALSGAFMLIRREAYEQTHGFDEQFFMYGEDLDLCYRIQQAGWTIMYIPGTRIIHYKGESARRSDIDEVRLFYEAMRLFARKHIHRGFATDFILRMGIALREGLAFAARIARPLRSALFDALLVLLSLFAAQRIWFGSFFRFPAASYPVIGTAVPLTVIATLFLLGVYTERKLSIRRTSGGVLLGYLAISALTFFFNQYAYSRMVVVISGAISFVLLPSWRFLARTLFRSPEAGRGGLFGRRTLIVGVDASGQEVLRKLRGRVDDGYEVVGFVDTGRKRIGEKVAGVEILGSIDNIGRVIYEQRASEVIFSTDSVSYADILSVIGRTRMHAVHFRLVPSSLEVIIGKTHIDVLDDIPLVDIDYAIDRPSHRLAKRSFDVVCSLVLLVTVYPFVPRRSGGRFAAGILRLPDVLGGRMSMVGPQEADVKAAMYIGRPGITGLAQINEREGLTAAEIEQYNLYYAKNQSLVLDMEILLKSLLLALKK